MVQRKEFKAPEGKVVKVFSDDNFHSALIEDTWTTVREELWRAAYGEGCISKDMMVKGFNKEQTLAAVKAEAMIYEQQVLEVMKDIIATGDPEEVDSVGRPKQHILAQRLDKAPPISLRNKLFKLLED